MQTSNNFLKDFSQAVCWICIIIAYVYCSVEKHCHVMSEPLLDSNMGACLATTFLGLGGLLP